MNFSEPHGSPLSAFRRRISSPSGSSPCASQADQSPMLSICLRQLDFVVSTVSCLCPQCACALNQASFSALSTSWAKHVLSTHRARRRGGRRLRQCLAKAFHAALPFQAHFPLMPWARCSGRGSARPMAARGGRAPGRRSAVRGDKAEIVWICAAQPSFPASAGAAFAGNINSRSVSGSSFCESSVEPTRSQSMTVS